MTMKPIQSRFRWCSICTDDENNDNSHIPASATGEPYNGSSQGKPDHSHGTATTTQSCSVTDIQHPKYNFAATKF